MDLKFQKWFNNPILRKISEEFTDFWEVKELDKKIRDFLAAEENWVWIAAPQVWINKRLFLAEFDKKKVTTVVNPKILQKSKTTLIKQEGCLSLAWVWANVERSKSILVEYQDIKWKKISGRLEWFAAQVFQHELDHLDWILFMDRFVWNSIEVDEGVDLKELGLDKLFV